MYVGVIVFHKLKDFWFTWGSVAKQGNRGLWGKVCLGKVCNRGSFVWTLVSTHRVRSLISSILIANCRIFPLIYNSLELTIAW